MHKPLHFQNLDKSYFYIYKEFSSIVKYFKLNQSSALMDELLDNRQ